MKPKQRPAAALLKPQQRAFVRFYDANGGNGTKAYLASHPDCKSRQAAAQGAFETLRNPEVQAQLQALEADRWVRLQMSGDEALARVAQDARADIRDLVDDEGKFLPLHHWPESVAHSVKSFRATLSTTGAPTVIQVTMNDPLAARRMVLEQQGKLKNPLGAVGELARLLAGENPGDEDA